MLLARPLAAVFDQLATPRRLGDWLPEVAAVKGEAQEFGEIGTGTVFGLRLRKDGQEIAGTGEVIAYEPPWSVAYRLVTASQTYVLWRRDPGVGPPGRYDAAVGRRPEPAGGTGSRGFLTVPAPAQ